MPEPSRSLTRRGLTAALLAAGLVGLSAEAKQGWQQIEVPSSVDVTLPDGSKRLVAPSCSGGPKAVGPGGLEFANTDFSFFVKQGNPSRVLFYLDGGGACWDAATCIGSPLSDQIPSTYTQEVDETPQALDQAGGIFDDGDPDNPYANYTKVFVPYCTGDIHWGSKDTTYTLPGFPPLQIRHRGTDNFLAAIHLLNTEVRKNKNKLLVDLANAKDITVAGSSAGGYGATLAFTYVAEQARRARGLNLISDAAVGVLTEDFYNDVIFDTASPGSSSWAIAENLPSWVPAFEHPESFLTAAAVPTPFDIDGGGPVPEVDLLLGFQPALFQALADYRPDAQLASMTTNLDLVQVRFFGATVPTGTPPTAIAGQWFFAASTMLNATASNGNYRFFLDDGTCHTYLGDFDCPLFDEGVNGISVGQWIENMIKPGNRAWDNLNAGPPSAP